MTAITRSDRYSMEAARQRWEEWLGFKAVVLFFSTKAVRSGPRYMIQIAIVLIVGFVLTRLLLPYRLAEALDYSTQVVGWVTGEQPQETVEEQDGGLRIVVFGAPDIATPPRITGSKHEDIGLSWTEHMCEELDCMEHLSFVPTSDGPVHSITSNSLYDNALGRLIAGTRESKEPGMNYTFMKQFYNNPIQYADLDAQVAAFLAMDKPEVTPRETLYVFSFGMWDVWHLAGMPLDQGYAAIGDFARHIFHHAEKLYQETMKPESVAYSSGRVVDRNSTTSSRSGDDPGSFRIIVPRLFDPSMAPGWKFRPTPPKPHNNPEHTKNSAYLTMRWNWEMNSQMQNWIHMEDTKVEKRSPRSPPSSLNGSSSRPSGAGKTETAESSSASPEAVSGDSGDRLPVRDVIVPEMANYLVNSMIDSQMKYSGLQDHTPGSKLGALPSKDSFPDGVSACITFREAVSGQYQVSTTGATCGKHLFLSEFSVTQRAIERIGLEAADMVTDRVGVRTETKMTGRRPGNANTPTWKTRVPKTF